MSVYRSILARSYNHCCREKAVLYILIACRLSYPACNAQALCYSGSWGMFIPHDLTNGTIFGDELFNTQIPNFTKIRPVRAEMFRADRQRDMIKLTADFRNSASESEILKFINKM